MYYVLYVSRNHGKIVDKYYRKSKDEILSLESQIIFLFGKDKTIFITKYFVKSPVDSKDIIYF